MPTFDFCLIFFVCFIVFYSPVSPLCFAVKGGSGFTINNTYLCPLVCHLPFTVHTNTVETHEECVVVFYRLQICMFLSGTFICMFEWVRLRRRTAFATTERGPRCLANGVLPPKLKQRGINCNGINNIANLTQFHGGHTCSSRICRLLVLISYYFPMPLHCPPSNVSCYATLPIFIRFSFKKPVVHCE